LGNTAFTAQVWDTAIEGFAVAIEAVEQSHSWATSELRRQEILEEANDIYQKIVEACVAHGRLDKAIEYVERSKARNLIDLIATRDLYPKGDIPTESLYEFKRLQREIEAEYRKIDIAERKPFKEGNINSLADTMPDRTHLNQLRQKLDDLIIREIQPIDPTFSLTYRVEPISFKQIQALLPDDNTSILEWYITDDIFLTFIITRQAIQPLVWQSSSEDREALIDWVKEYLQDYSENKSQWKDKLSKCLQCLAQILHIGQILSYLPPSCNQLILIPHRFLHLLPLHALPLAEEQHCLLDSFTKGVSYTPNCQLLQLSQKRQRPDFTHLFAIQNPTQDLMFTDLEVEMIRQHFLSSDVLVKEAARKEVLDNQRLHDVHCLHFSCHGYFDFEYPLNSALILAGAVDSTSLQQANTVYKISSREGSRFNLEKCLTLGDIFNFNLSQCRLVTLSACETGLTDSTRLSDEYISLAIGFLVAGSRSVVGSLWTVEELSTAFLMIKFYENLQSQISVGTALSQAQLWLRNATLAELEPWLMQRQLLLSNKQKRLLLGWFRLSEADEQPFQSPFYWAGFCASGQS
jgi:CHAT domain-containing protein